METTETLATGGMDWDNTHWENPNATKKARDETLRARRRARGRDCSTAVTADAAL